jgi:hypothetical protein
MKKTSVSMLAAVAACGFPTNDGQFSLAAVAHFPENLNQFGAEGSFNLAGPLALNASYLNTSEDDVDGSANTFAGGLSFDVTSLVGTGPATISLCPTAQFQYTTFNFDDAEDDGDLSRTNVPVGLGFGTSLPIGLSSALQPYVIPQIVFSRASLEGESTDWENDFGLRGGANLVFGQFFVGAEVNKVFGQNDEEGEGGYFLTGDDLTFGIKAGIRL